MGNNFKQEDELGWRRYLKQQLGGKHGIHIQGILNNDPDVKDIQLEPDVSGTLSAAAWEFLGVAISDNDHLEAVCISTVHDFIDSDMSMLFRGLMHGGPMKELTISGYGFGLSGIQSMVPFLQYSRNLRHLAILGSHNINAECFEVLVGALQGSRIETLSLSGSLEDISPLEVQSYPLPHLLALDGDLDERCGLPHLRTLYLDRNNIQNISSLEHYTRLEELYLEGNDIGEAGLVVISKLLKNEDSCLRTLDMNATGMGDDEAEMLADSLKYNTTLKELSLLGNQFGEQGYRAFLKLLVDVSSIKQTYHSNRSLISIDLPSSSDKTLYNINEYIGLACQSNGFYGHDSWHRRGNPEAVGRAKVLEAQLDSRNRMELARLQGIDDSYLSLFSKVDRVLLPEIFLIAASTHGQNETYCMLLAMPELVANANKVSLLGSHSQDIGQIDGVAVAADRTQGLVDRDILLDKDRAKYWSKRLGVKRSNGRRRNWWRNMRAR